MKKVLVTGGTGFIGSHLVVMLLEKGYEVIILDSLINSSKKVIERIYLLLQKTKFKSQVNLRFYEGDILDSKILRDIFSDAEISKKPIDAVIHLAGLKSVEESIKSPIKYWDINLRGTINLIKTMIQFNCFKIVFSSSATIYDIQNDNPIKENTFINPINPYGQTKAVIEKFLNDLSNSHSQNWSISCLRYFNPIGAHSSGLIGEDPLNKPTNIFPIICKVAQGIIDEVKIFGNDWNTRDGTCIRDFIHVMDLSEGHIFALEKILKEEDYFLKLNLGTGLGTTVLELINKFQEVNKLSIPYSFVKRREGDRSIVIADNSLASSFFAWTPSRSIEEMCRDGWLWQYSNK